SGQIAIDLVGHASNALVTLQGAGGEIGRQADRTIEGRGRVVIEYEPASEGFVTLEAKAEAAGSTSSLRSTFAVQRPLQGSYLGGRVANAREKLSQLLGNGFGLKSPAPSDASAASELAHSDLAILDDVTADSVPDDLEQEIATAVTDHGLGLVMCGGESAFG